MKISAFTYVRNGLQYLYPFLESIQSVLPIVDEFIVVVGDSEDGTKEAILNLNSDKIKIVDTIWDMSLRVGGKIFAQQSNLGLDQTTGDWMIHIQADEVIHEQDIFKFKEYILKYDTQPEVEGLLLPFLNFKGDYCHIQTSRNVHQREIRAFRKNPLIRAYRDSQGFRKYSSLTAYNQGEKGEKLRVVKIDVPIYHYTAVRPPKKMLAKYKFFSRFYNPDEKLEKDFDGVVEFDYNKSSRLDQFNGTHPKVMEKVISEKDWNFKYDPTKAKISLRHRFLNAIEALTGYRIGEFKNYKLIKGRSSNA